MQGDLVTRRTQFSSCDECRRSRVACDAAAQAKIKNGDADLSSVQCSRCVARGTQCTFNWVKENKEKAAKKKPTKRKTRRRRGTASIDDKAASKQAGTSDGAIAAAQTYRSPYASDLSSPLAPVFKGDITRSSVSIDLVSDASVSPSFLGASSSSPEAISPIEAQWLSTIYHMGFEIIFGSWMGRHSCPFVFGEHSERNRVDQWISISNICGQLDQWMAEDVLSDQQNSALKEATRGESERNRQIDESLQRSIYSFSARWLPLTSTSAPQDSGESHTIQAVWRLARRDMLKVINRPSYRSMLTLFLFALTPIPDGISEDEETDGISGQSCVHAALQHIQILRARQRNLQFSGTKVTPCLKKQAIFTNPDGTSDFINLENIAYWAALTFDTSASLTLNCRPLLSSGLFGFEKEAPWSLVRTCYKIFSEISQQWQPESIEDMTDERANEIVGAGAAWKLLGWKLTAVFKEALRDGHEEFRVQEAYAAVVESIQNFNTTFRPLLEACQRRIQFLSQQTKLRWFSLMLHYHLSILMLVDIVEATERYDLLAELQATRLEAEITVMDTLVFGLENTCTLSINKAPSADTSQDGAERSQTITVPLTSIDPYPHHIVACIQLVWKTIERDFSTGKIAEESYNNLRTTLERTLSLLPQSSKSVQATRAKLSENVPEDGMRHEDPYRILQGQFVD